MINTNYDNQVHPGVQQTGDVGGVQPTTTPVTTDELPAIPTEPENDPATTLPQVPAPKVKVNPGSLNMIMTAVPSLGATALSMTMELTDSIRRSNSEMRYQEQQVVVSKLHEQADTMRDQAITNLCMSITVSAIQIGSAVYQVGASAYAMKSAGGYEGAEMQAAFLQNQNIKIQATAQGINAVGSIVGGVKDFASSMFDVEMKHRDAEIERHRSFLTQLDSLNDALKQVIQSAIQNQNAIQRNVNETRVKILS